MKKFYFLIVILCVFKINCNAQGWEKQFSSFESFYDVVSLEDEGFACLAKGYGNNKYFLLKINKNGDSVSCKEFLVNGLSYLGSLIKTSDGGFAAGGSIDGHTPLLVKTNKQGDVIFSKTYTTSRSSAMASVVENPNGGFFLTTSVFAFIKTNENGIVDIQSELDQDFMTSIFDMERLEDGNLICSGYSNPSNDNYSAKLDTLGNIIWEKDFNIPGQLFGVSKLKDNGFLLTGFFTNNNFNGSGGMLKIDSMENVEMNKSYNYYTRTLFNDGKQCVDKGFIFAGNEIGTHPGGAVPSDTNVAYFSVFKIDHEGNVLWTKRKTMGFLGSGANKVIQTDDLGYLAVGTLGNHGYLMKLDYNGDIYVNTISGKLFLDKNNNCHKDVGEPPLVNWVVSASPGNFYTTTDSLGNYQIKVNQGNFTVKAEPKNPSYELKCPTIARNVSFNGLYQSSVNNDFAFQGFDCAYLKVDVTTPFMRRCFKNTTYVYYINEGSKDEDNVIVNVEIPESFIYKSSSIPAVQSGNLLSFDIGTVLPGTNKFFTIVDSLDCSVPLGTTHCVKARISPINNCFQDDPVWDRSSVNVIGKCAGDSIVNFSVKNKGDGDMTKKSDLRVYFNNELDSTGTFQLQAGEETILNIYSRGKTLRVEADQLPGHPGLSRPSEAIEGCGSHDFGFIMKAPQDDMDEFVEIDCHEAIGSFDPNDKSVVPQGITSNNYVSSGTEFEYTIRFQNTGTDTAFTVKVLDPISPNLDLSTFKMMTAGHKYSYKVNPGVNNVIEWKFDNILLPDSNVNEAKSHGYIKYKIKAKPNLNAKSLIENTAAIYFDFNEPVYTNTTKSVVFDTVLIGKHVVLGTMPKVFKNDKVTVYPNPFSDKAKISISDNGTNHELYIFDSMGKLRRHFVNVPVEFEFGREDISEGIYIYQVMSVGEIVGTGKIVVIK